MKKELRIQWRNTNFQDPSGEVERWDIDVGGSLIRVRKVQDELWSVYAPAFGATDMGVHGDDYREAGIAAIRFCLAATRERQNKLKVYERLLAEEIQLFAD